MGYIKVLVVEDDSMMAFLHKEVIKSNNISSSPLSFKNGKDAMDFIVEDAAEDTFYMILLDLNMPVMNGWQFLDELEKTRISYRTKVVIVTSSIDPADREKAEMYKTVENYLSKPLLDLSPIKQAVKNLENRRKSS